MAFLADKKFVSVFNIIYNSLPILTLPHCGSHFWEEKREDGGVAGGAGGQVTSRKKSICCHLRVFFGTHDINQKMFYLTIHCISKVAYK